MRLHHLAFRTDDLSALEHFYGVVLGLPLIRRHEGRSVWLDAGGIVIMLERCADGEPAIPEEAMEVVAFAIAPSDRALVAGRLNAAGLVIEARTAYTLYVRDPDGRRVGLSSYPEELE
jgi:glyoxylase I family protein